MNATEKLTNLLRQYIEESNKIKEEYRQKRLTISLYEELIQALKENDIEDNKMFISILLNTIYGDNIYVDEFYRISFLPDKEEQLKKFLDKIINEYNSIVTSTQNLKERIDRNQNMVPSANRVIASLKYQTKITNSKNDINNIKRIISYFEISGIISRKEELLLINEIELHNRKVATKHARVEEKDYAESLYNEIPNILTLGLQQHDVIEVSQDRKTSLDKFSQEIINLINYLGINEITNIIEDYKKYNLDTNEYNYIIVKVLDNYLEELMTLYELLIDKEIYSNRSERNEVIKNYYEILEKYIIIMNYYNQINTYVPDEMSDESEEETIIESVKEKRLIYAHSKVNITKSKMIFDLHDISYEYYENIYNLIKKFKEGTLGNKKIKTIQHGHKSDGRIELKDDDIRIILKRVNDNIYCVLGVLIKKGNNDMGTYKTINNRTVPDVSNEEKLELQLKLSKITEEELERLVQEKARKNGRK